VWRSTQSTVLPGAARAQVAPPCPGRRGDPRSRRLHSADGDRPRNAARWDRVQHLPRCHAWDPLVSGSWATP